MNWNSTNKPIHQHVRCDGCSVIPIRGIRYKCSICPDFDYWEEWENLKYHLHPILKIKDEQSYKKYRKDFKGIFIKISEVNEVMRQYVPKVIDKEIKNLAPRIENIISKTISKIICFKIWNKY